MSVLLISILISGGIFQEAIDDHMEKVKDTLCKRCQKRLTQDAA